MTRPVEKTDYVCFVASLCQCVENYSPSKISIRHLVTVGTYCFYSHVCSEHDSE